MWQLLDIANTGAAGMEFAYEPWLVVLSCLIGLAAAYAALRAIWKIEGADGYRARLLIVAASCAMGIGTWSMHFLGMLALEGAFEMSFRPLLTAASILPAIVASGFGLIVIVRPHARPADLLISGVTLGAGISAMHYMGMAAITLDARMHFDSLRTIQSVVVACALAACALHIVRRARQHPSTELRMLALSAVCLGAAVSLMHYLGMSAIQLLPMEAEVTVPSGWDEGTLALLVTLGTVLVLIAVVSASAIDRRLFAIRARVRGRAHQILAAIEGLTEGFIVFDEHRRAVVWNAQVEDISAGVRRVLRPGVRYEEIFAVLDHSPCRRIDLPEEEIVRQQCELELEDGSCVEITQSRTTAGYLVVSFSDITAHRRGKERLREFFDKAPYPFFAVNRTGVIVSVNQACLRTFGYEEQELVGQSVCILVPVERREAMLLRVQQCLDVGTEGAVPSDVEPRGVRKNGTVFPVEASFGVLDFNREPLVVFGVKDLSERREMEAQLLQSQKMELVGQLTGGLAHDFNNLLTVITGNLQLLEAFAEPDSQGAEQIRDAIEATKRGSDLTKRLLAFSRRQLLAPKPISVGKLVTDLVPLMHKSITAGIEIITKLPEDLWTVEVDPGQLESALLNLAINARDAMPQGGKIVIESRNVVLDADYSRRRSEVEPGDYVMITVCDTGIGMPPDVLEQAFEPFFSTKDSGRGSGLGLSTVYGFVKQSKGHISIYSEPDFGTSVRVYLPRTEAAAESPTVATASHRIIPSGEESILLVDDDPSVRRTVAQLLESLGYDIAEAGTGAEALALFEQGERFDLLLTDIVMPGGISGLDLARQVKAYDPAMRILLTSGYTDTALFARGVLGPDDHVLNKPYRKAELAQKLRWMLDEDELPPASYDEAESRHSA